MNRILATTALTLALAAPAMAQTNMLRDSVAQSLAASPTDVQVEALTDEQVRALYVALSGTESAADRERLIESIVGDAQYDMEANMAEFGAFGAENSIREAVAQMADENEIEVDVNTLSSDQVAALYLQFTGGEGADAQEVEAILQ